MIIKAHSPSFRSVVMRKDIALPVLALAGGGACLALRRWQLAAALDPETELFHL